jgi:branched-chain amino acid transport system ATP-binding protein
MIVLRAENIHKSFGGVKALQGVSMSVEEGEIVGLIGPNGAGKTTLFNVITGFYPPDKGRVEVFGKDVTGWPPHRVAGLGVARTFQIPKPFHDLTVYENVLVSIKFSNRRLSELEAAEEAKRILEFLGLDKYAHMLAAQLNVALEKRLELARALARNPKLLLLDEVLAGLNPAEVSFMLEKIRKAKQEFGLTIVMIEHVMHAVMNLADRIVVLHLGRKLAEGTPEEIAANPQVIEAYLGDPKLALAFVKKFKEGAKA